MSKLASILELMGSIDEPWELFEPYLYKDKLGDSCWKCEVRSVDALIWYGEGATAEQAVEACYDQAMRPSEHKAKTKASQGGEESHE